MEASPIALDGVDDAPGEPHLEPTDSPENAGDDAEHNPEPTIWGEVGGIPTLGTRPRKKRGRHAKDPLAQSVYFQCSRLEDLEACLKDYLANPIHPAEHTTLEFTFPVTSAFMIPAREIHARHGMGDTTDTKIPIVYSLFKRSAVSVVDSLYNISDPKEQMIVQKGIAKAIVDSIASIDGFHYSFHNNWLSNADQANRFSYYCNDSVLNKGRAANEGISKIRNSIKIRKPVYACEGGIWIKFSVSKNNLEIQYKHIPMHPTFDATAPLPRNGSKRRRLMELFNPELLPGAKPRVKKLKPPKPPKPPKEPKALKEPRKRKLPPDPVAPKRKRRAIEPNSQADDTSTPQSAQERENSLQPLFDFLGSAGRLEQNGGAISGPATPREAIAPSTAAAPPTLIENDDDMFEYEDVPETLDQVQPFPGMLSGFMNNKEIRWGSKSAPQKRIVRRMAQGSQQQQPTQNGTGPMPPSTMAIPAAEPQANGATPIPAPLSEMDALKRKLMEAEEKIRSLEAHNLQPQSNTTPHHSTGVPPQYLPPPHPHHPQAQLSYYPPPGQWQYPPPHPPFYPPYPFSYGPPGHPGLSGQPPITTAHPQPSSLPPSGSGPPPLAPSPAAGSAPTPPQQSSDQSAHTLPQSVQPNAPPSYGFIPNPAEFIATKIRPHLVSSAQSAQNMPSRVPILPALPILPTPEPPREQNYLSELRAHAAWPSQGHTSNPPQSSSLPQTQPLPQGRGPIPRGAPTVAEALKAIGTPALTIIQEQPQTKARANESYGSVPRPQSQGPPTDKQIAQSQRQTSSREMTPGSQFVSQPGMLSFLPDPPLRNPLAAAISTTMAGSGSQQLIVTPTSASLPTSTSFSEPSG